MKSKAQVVIVAADPGHPSKLREELLVLCFQSTITTSVVQARKLLNSSPNSMLMVFFGQSQEAGFMSCKELLTCPDVHTKPILLVGQESTDLIPQTAKVFALSHAVEDFRNHRIIAEEVAKLWVRFQEHQSERLQQVEASLDAAARIDAPEQETSASPKSPSQEIFEQVERLGIFQKLIGGALYARRVRPKPFMDFLNEQPGGLTSPAARAMKDADSAIVAHSARLAYLTNRMLSVVGLDEELVNAGTRAALLHATSFKTKRRMVYGNYLQAEHEGARARMVKGVRESATIVSFEFGLPEESTVLAFFARLLGSEEVSRDKPQFLCASALVAADALDRIAWSSGYFNPQRAYNVLRLCKRGEFALLHPSIVAALIKLTSEAIVAAPLKFAMPRVFLDKYRTRQKNGAAHADRPLPGEKSVPIEKLSPGMRLSRPLKTFDGTQVLEADMKLDADLIWRIWQLSAIRPVETAMVSTANGKPKTAPDSKPPPVAIVEA